MIYRNLNIHDFLIKAKNKTIICFGAGNYLAQACAIFEELSFFEKIDFIADNNSEKQRFMFRGVEKSIYSIEYCLRHSKKEPVLLITISDCFEVLEQLETIPALKNSECFFFALIREMVRPHYSLPKNRALNEPLKIPKTIHYCWFGGTPIPDYLAEYMKSWNKYCPDYEIVRWDESNYDYKKNEYMYEAYTHKKWGFVPDYARLDIISKYGGVYLDTDVELVRNIDDLLCDKAFCGFESPIYLNNGLGFGAVANFPLIANQLDVYNRISFVNTDGTLNLTPGPYYQTEFFRQKGVLVNNTLQNIDEMTFYPSDVLAPMSFIGTLTPTENTYSIHHFSVTWYDTLKQKSKEKVRKKYAELMGKIET